MEYRRKGKEKGKEISIGKQRSGTGQYAAITLRLIGKEGPDEEAEPKFMPERREVLLCTNQT